MNLLEPFRTIHTIITDVDGVLTDGRVSYDDLGQKSRTYCNRDAVATHIAREHGLRLAAITRAPDQAVKMRLKHMQIEHISIGVNDKHSALKAFFREHNLDGSGVLYLGDDVPDYAAMRLVELPCCPSDAAQEIQAISLYICQAAGGQGCLREVLERVLKLQGKWPYADNYIEVDSY